MNEADLKKAGITIREKIVANKQEYQVVDGKRVISRHAAYVIALAAAKRLLKSEEGN